MSKTYLEKIPILEEAKFLEFCWNQHPTDPMSFVVYNYGVPVLVWYLGEAINAAGYKNVMRYIRECDNDQTFHIWQEERKKELIDILTQ